MAEKRARKAEEEAKEQLANENIRRKQGKVCNASFTRCVISAEDLPFRISERSGKS